MAKLGGVTVAGWGCRSCVPQRMGCDDVGPRLCDRTHLRVLLRTLQQARVLLRTLQQACHGRTSETTQPQAPVRSGEQCCCGQPTKLAAPPQQTVCTLPSRRRTRRSAVQRRFQDDLQCRGVSGGRKQCRPIHHKRKCRLRVGCAGKLLTHASHCADTKCPAPGRPRCLIVRAYP